MKTNVKPLLLGAVAVLALQAPMAVAQDEPTIGVIVPTLDAQFWNNYADFMREGADALGVDLVVLNADNRPDQMIRSLEDLVAQGVDGIIYTPYWATAAPGLTLARRRYPGGADRRLCRFPAAERAVSQLLGIRRSQRRGRRLSDGTGAVRRA